MSLLPSRSPLHRDDVGPGLRSLEEASDQVFEVLRCETAREVLRTIYEEPGVASEVADRLETSLQTVHYHLGNLREAGLIEVADTWYSEKGTEMKVYAPADEPLMLVVGGPDDVAVCAEALETLE